MAALIGALRVDLSADTASFTNGMKRAEKQAQKSASTINKSFSTIKTAAAGFLTGISAASLIKLGKNALDYASSLAEVSQQLGVTTKDLQALRYAATQLGVSQEEIDKGLGKLTITLGQVAAGAKAPTAALKAIGITAAEIKGKDTGTAFRMIADGLKPIADRAQRAAVEVALFGRTGAKLDTMLAGGSKALNDLATAAENLGIVLSDEQIQNADRTADRLAELKQVLEARISGVIADNASAILSLANALASMTVAIANFMATNPVKAAALMGAIGGGLAAGIPGAVGGAILGAGVADMGTEKRLRSSLHANSKNLMAQYRVNNNNINAPVVQELIAQRKALKARLAALTGGGSVATPTGLDSPTGVDVPKFLSGGGGKDNSAAEAERKRKEALRNQFQYDMDIARAQMDELRAREDLAVETQDKASLSLKQLELEREIERKQTKFDLDMGDITQKQAEEREMAGDRIFALRKQKLTLDAEMEVQEQRLRLEREMGELTLDGLQIESGLAETAKERREVELRILDARLKLERQALQAIVDNDRLDADVRQAADRRLQFLDKREPQMREAVRRDNAGPLERYMRTLPTSAAKLDEALQGVAVNGLGSIEDGILDVINGTKSLAAAFRDMAQSIISDLLRIAIQRSVTIPLANALFGGGSSGIMTGPSVSGGGGWLGKLLGFGASLAGSVSGGGVGLGKSVGGNISKVGFSGLKVPAFATGGSFRIGGKHGYDTNLLSLNGQPIAKVSRGETMGILPGGAASAGRRGDTFHITVPGSASREDRRQTALQVGAEVRRIMTDASRKGA